MDRKPVLLAIDESGDDRTISSPSSGTQPVTAYGCVLLSQATLAQLTRDFIDLKRQYFPGRVGAVPSLSDILVEVKGKDIRKILREGHLSIGGAATSRRVPSDGADGSSGSTLAERQDAGGTGRRWFPLSTSC